MNAAPAKSKGSNGGNADSSCLAAHLEIERSDACSLLAALVLFPWPACLNPIA
jgi:hypothetical protein